MLMILATVLVPTSPAAASRIVVGEPFPTDAFATADDRAPIRTIEQYRGKRIVLHVFASW